MPSRPIGLGLGNHTYACYKAKMQERGQTFADLSPEVQEKV